MDKPSSFTEMHNTRMVRKFGSMEQFDRVKKAHGLIPRGAVVGLDATCGFHQPQLDKRVQSSTMNSHRLILYVAETHGLEQGEALYEELNRKHFIEAGVLNDKSMLIDAMVAVLNLNENELKEAIHFLNDERRGYDVVLQYVDRVADLGIHSIPTLIVDGRLSASGAQTWENVLNLFERAVESGVTGKRLFGDLSVKA